MTTVDSWLLDLADGGPAYAEVAYALAQMQYAVSKDLGHIPALNDNFVRSKIRTAARVRVIASVNVRCLRCMAVASLKHWCYIANRTERERHEFFLTLPMATRYEAGRCLKPCEGDLQAQRKLDTLRASVEDES